MTILEFANHFGLTTIYSSPKSIKRKFTIASIDRPGLELTGFFKYHGTDKLTLVGNKEIAYLKTLTDEEIYDRVKKIADEATPGVVFTHGNPVPPVFLKACMEKDCPVFQTGMDTSSFMSEANTYLAESLSPHTSMHACLLEIFGEGVLFLGESGIGKSEISLELIKKGHRLISDDKVDITVFRGRIFGRAPEVLFGMLEVRGIGIIDVPRMFGINALAKSSEIKYAIQLIPYAKEVKLERVGIKTEYMEILGQKIPLVKLPVSAARSMAEIIEAAVTNFKLKDFGYDSSFEFEKRMAEIVRRREKESK